MARLGLPSLSTAQELALGALAGAFAQIFTIPVSVIALRQQISNSKSSKSLLQVGREIVHENGWTGLWTGLKPGLVLTVNPAITYGVFERVKGVVLARPGRAPAQLGRLTVGESFWIGVASKTLATVVTYPYIFVSILGLYHRVETRVESEMCRPKYDYKLNRPVPPRARPNNPPRPARPTPPLPRRPRRPSAPVPPRRPTDPNRKVLKNHTPRSPRTQQQRTRPLSPILKLGNINSNLNRISMWMSNWVHKYFPRRTRAAAAVLASVPGRV